MARVWSMMLKVCEAWVGEVLSSMRDEICVCVKVVVVLRVVVGVVVLMVKVVVVVLVGLLCIGAVEVECS